MRLGNALLITRGISTQEDAHPSLQMSYQREKEGGFRMREITTEEWPQFLAEATAKQQTVIAFFSATW